MPWSPPSTFRLSNHFVIDAKSVAASKDPMTITHYEVHVSSNPKAKEKDCTVLITRDEALHDRALALVGTEVRVHVDWHRGFRPDGQPGQVIADFEPVLEEITEIA